MVVVKPAQAIWTQLSKFSFASSGLQSDLLLVRTCLVSAYFFLLIEALLGSPTAWGQVTGTGLAIDTLVWAFIGLYIHGSSLVSFVLDERAVKFTDDEGALWRLLYRSGGLSARLFKTIVAPYMEVVELAAGDEIPTKDFFYVIYTGCVELEIKPLGPGERLEARCLLSGQIFPLKYLGMLRPANLFSSTELTAMALTDTKLFRFTADDMKKIAGHKFAKGVMQALLVNQLTCIVESYMKREPKLARDTVDRIFLPLRPSEEPNATVAGSGVALRKPLLHFWKSLCRSLTVPPPFGTPPTGLRQTQLPAPTAANLEETVHDDDLFSSR